MPTSLSSPTAKLHITEIRTSWGWFVALGIAFVVLGFIALAHLLTSTLVTALYVGALVLVAGIVEILHAFRVQSWGRFLFWLLGGVLYVIAGGLIMYQPLLAAGVITLMIGVSLVVGGGFRIFAAIGARPAAGWGFLALSGVITFLLGVIIIAGWPVNSVFLLGLFLGIDLIVNGVTTVLFGFALRQKAP